MFTRRELFNLMEDFDLCFDPKSQKLYLKRLIRAGYLKPFHRQGKYRFVNPEIERITKKSQLEKTLDVSE